MEKLFNKWRGYNDKLDEAECRVNNESLGYQEDDQPQIAPNDIQNFILYLREQGIQCFKTNIAIMDLKPSQETIDWDKVKQIAQQGFDSLVNGTPIFVGTDNYVADGHHRFYALKLIDKHAEMPVWQAQCETPLLIKLMKQFNTRQEKDDNTTPL